MTINEPNLKTLDAAMADAAETGALSTQFEKITVQSLVHEYLEAQNLNVLSESLIQNAVDEFVGKGDKDAVGKCVAARPLPVVFVARSTLSERASLTQNAHPRAAGSRSSCATRATTS